MNRRVSTPPFLSAWVWLCAYLNCAGWILSAVHQLNAAGYAIALAAGLAGAGIFRRQFFGGLNLRSGLIRTRRRCRRFFPAFFFIVAGLVLAGGGWYAPGNYDALTYRLPRVLEWLSAGHWHWIATINERMNFSGTVWEWLAAPQLALLRSDRGLFLINVIGFLFLPGMLFAIFRQLGVARRTAWTWMWLLPLGYGYATQAGSIGNDLIGAVFCLASINFGLRARSSLAASDIWTALVAAALMTGVKLSNLPLALPCLVAVWPALFQSGRHWRTAPVVAVAAVCVMVSALPIMGLNWKFTGSWTGDPHNQYQVEVANPAAAVAVNGFLVGEHALVPPVLPDSRIINKKLEGLLPVSLKQQYPRLPLHELVEIPGEDNASLGLTVTLPLLLVLAAAAAGLGRQERWKRLVSAWRPVTVAAWIALLVCLAKLGSEAIARLLLPYYALVIIPILCVPGQEHWLRGKAWRLFLMILALGVLPVLVLSAYRPLGPAITVSSRLARSHPQNHLLARLAQTYEVFSRKNDVLAPLREALPAKVKTVGLIAGGNDASYSLWRPFGQRRVVDLRADISRFLAQPATDAWVVVKENQWPKVSPVPLKIWAAEHHADMVIRVPITEVVSWGPEYWVVLHFPAKT